MGRHKTASDLGCGGRDHFGLGMVADARSARLVVPDSRGKHDGAQRGEPVAEEMGKLADENTAKRSLIYVGRAFGRSGQDIER